MPKTSVSTPRVTFLVGCYNHSDYVTECVDSIKNQTYKNIEIIIWDDCSKDNSVNKIKQWILQNEKSIECSFIENNENIGLCKSLNKALEKACGKYIAITSADDMQLPDRIERQVRILNASSEKTGVVYADAINVNMHGESQGTRVLDYFSYDKYPSGNVFDQIFNERFIPPSMATLTKKICFDTVGYYDESLMIEDYDMWLRVSNSYEFIYDPIPGASYRNVEGSMSRDSRNYGVIKMACKEARGKCYFMKEISDKYKRMAQVNLVNLARYNYINGLPIRDSFISKISKSPFSFGISNTIVCLFMAFGIDRSVYKRTYDIINKFSK